MPSTRHINRLIRLLPLIAPSALAGFGVVAVFFLLLDQFRSVLVWPLGLLAAVLVCAPIVKARTTAETGNEYENHVCDALVILGVGAWILFNLFFTSQHFLTNRDPGTYATAGAWLTRHNDIEPPVINAFGRTPQVEPYSGGFMPDTHDATKLNAQGQHLLPALLGLSGRIVGAKNMVRINVLIGGVALLAVYGFARLLARPRWALVATGAVALSLPMMYFSRDTYTEPLATTFTFGALSLLWVAQKNRSLKLWLIAGVVAGAGTLTRIDAYLVLAEIMAFLIVLLALSQGPARRMNILNSLSFVISATVVGVLGFLDISKLSTSYYLSQRNNLRPELLLLALLVLAGIVVVGLAWRTDILTWLDMRTRAWRAKAIWATVIIIALILASRPLWYVGHGIASAVIVNGVAVTGPGRNFSEQTVNWLIWYLGPIMTLLGAFGMAYIASETSKRKDLLLVPAVFVIGATALFYLVRPSIFPDQIWASRRLLPVILPGLSVFGAVALERLYARRRLLRWNIYGKSVATILATLAFIGPLFVSLPFLTTREDAWYPPVEAVCKKLPPQAAVLWVGVARARFVEPTQAFCDKPSDGYGIQVFNVQGIHRDALARAARSAEAKGFIPVIGIYQSDAGLLNTKAQLTTVNSFTYKQIESTFTKPPRLVQIKTDTIQMGIINSDGSISRLNQ